jgi:exodeoxyribonuclease V alpha subunit
LKEIKMDALHMQQTCLNHGDRQFRLNAEVMQIRNNAVKEVSGGAIGRVCYINTEERELTVRFKDRNVLYFQDELGELMPTRAKWG